MRVDLRPTLEPVGVRLITGIATGVDVGGRQLLLMEGAVPFDRLVLATGSTLARPPIQGAEHMFDVDSYAGAIRLEEHLRQGNRVNERVTNCESAESMAPLDSHEGRAMTGTAADGTA